MIEEKVILVNESDEPIGLMPKLEAHEKALLHRAFSVFIFDPAGRLLLQRRASAKYHSGGLWSNTCCGHPRPGEDRRDAARRRLKEEMGIECLLAEAFSFIYRAALPGGLTEHEYDYVFFGSHDGEPVLDSAEAQDWKWMDLERLRADLQASPHAYTFWLAACLDRVIDQRRSPLHLARP